MKKLILIFTITTLITNLCSFSQTYVVTGNVTAFNQYPIKNMKIETKKSKAATTTDSLGRFNIVCQGKDRILFNALGFYSASKKVSEPDSLTINMVFKGGQKNEQLAMGYGYIDQEDLLYAVNHLTEENNDFKNYRDIFQLIQGKFPGVTINSQHGSPKVYIRGVNSVGIEQYATYIVDGVPVEDISYISVYDIKSIDILKDASAAQYGTKGSCGVIIITTKTK